MGVDQKRPLVGFAFVAVLCAVLMTISVGRGWADVFQPGKPIAAAALGGQVDRAPAPTPQPRALEDDAEITIPVELSAQPLGVAVGSPVSTQAAGGPTPGSTRSEVTATTPARQEDRTADRATAKAARQAEKAAAKAARQAEKAADAAARDAAKAVREVARLTDKLARRQ